MNYKSTVLALSLLLALPLTAVADGPKDDEHDEKHKIKAKSRTVIRVGDEGAQGKSRGFLGIDSTQLNQDLRRHFGVPEDAGVMISRVVPDSAASQAGLAVGDIITSIDGDTISGQSALARAIRKRGGEKVDLEVWREGRPSTFVVTLEERQSFAFDFGDIIDLEDLKDLEEYAIEWEAFGEQLGERFEDLDLEELSQHGLSISSEVIESVMESLEAIDWEEQMERLNEINLEGMEERMEEMQERLEELEERLEEEAENLSAEHRRALRERKRALRSEIETRQEEHITHARLMAREAAERAKVGKERALARAEAGRIRAEEARRSTQAQRAEARARAAAAAEAAAEATAGEGGHSYFM